MDKKFVIHNSEKFEYEVDEHGTIWVYIKNVKTNCGQVYPVNSTNDIENLVHKILDGAGY